MKNNKKNNLSASPSWSGGRDSIDDYFWNNFSKILKKGSANSRWNIYLWYQ